MMDKFATLEEEVNLIKQYIFIQKVRYDDRISFNLNILGDLSKVLVPGMTLQPFVENAFIHGIEPKEEGGPINITIYEKDEVFLVLIEDDGCGIEKQLLNKIIEEDIEQEHIGHTTGMGIKSVVKRLELMYEREDIFSIESIHGAGTKITLKLPLKEWKNIC
jgi:sensor histidine kinase YesM